MLKTQIYQLRNTQLCKHFFNYRESISELFLRREAKANIYNYEVNALNFKCLYKYLRLKRLYLQHFNVDKFKSKKNKTQVKSFQNALRPMGCGFDCL